MDIFFEDVVFQSLLRQHVQYQLAKVQRRQSCGLRTRTSRRILRVPQQSICTFVLQLKLYILHVDKVHFVSYLHHGYRIQPTALHMRINIDTLI